jgi:hypothetical protein
MDHRKKMTLWKSFFKANPTAWLLGDDNPSVKYLSLKEILGKHESSKEVRAAQKNIMEPGDDLQRPISSQYRTKGQAPASG